MNSRAADDLPELVLPGQRRYRLIAAASFLLACARAAAYIFATSWWKLTCVVICLTGLYGFVFDIDLFFVYSICLLDIAPQINSISFLTEAMRRNVMRIFWSMIIIIIILYIYSVFTYYFFREKYGLGDFRYLPRVASTAPLAYELLLLLLLLVLLPLILRLLLLLLFTLLGSDERGVCADLVDCFRCRLLVVYTPYRVTQAWGTAGCTWTSASTRRLSGFSGPLCT